MFHCESLGILFTGDGLVTMDLLGSRRGPQRMPPVFDLDTAQARRSLDRIRGIDCRPTATGTRPAVGGMTYA